MAKAEVVHQGDGVTVIFKGDKTKRPEPSVGVIKFPGGHVEVSRASDGSYWAHLEAADPSNIIDSRIDYSEPVGDYPGVSVVDLPHGEKVKKLAIRIAPNVLRFDEDLA